MLTDVRSNLIDQRTTHIAPDLGRLLGASMHFPGVRTQLLRPARSAILPGFD